MSTYQDEKKYSSLARVLANKDYAIIDTCSLMEDSFPEFLDILEETKKEYLDDSGFPVYVLESSLEELKRHAGNKDQKEKKIAATQAIRILAKAKRRKTIDIIKAVSGGKEDKKSKDKDEYYFADVEIISKVTLDRTKYDIAIITQDKKLASDLLNLNNSQAVHGSRVHVYKIDANAMLSENKGEERPDPSKRGAKKAGSSVLNKETSKPASEVKASTPKQSRHSESNELLNKVVQGDKRIHANLSNPNYGKDKLLSDLKTQLSDLKKVPSEKIPALKLTHSPDSIALEIKKIEHPEQFKTPEPVLAKAPEAPSEKKVSKKEAKGGLWYEYGATVEEAFRNAANHYGIFFRDPTVPYIPGIHGPLNFTTEDLVKIVASYGNTLKEGQKIVKQYRSVYLMAEKTQKGIKAWIDLNGLLAPQPAASEKEEKPKEAPKQVSKKKAEKPKEEVKVVEDPEENHSEPAPKPKAEKPKGKAPKKEVKPEEKLAETAQKEETSTSEPVQKQPSKAKPKQPKPEALTKEEEPKPEPKKAAKPKKKTHLEETIEFDAKLKADVNNPNYPKEQKIQDVQDQIARVKKVPLKDRGQLNFDLNALKTFLSILS